MWFGTSAAGLILGLFASTSDLVSAEEGAILDRRRLPDRRRIEERRLEKRSLIAENISDLKHEYRQRTGGRELTDEDIDAAIRAAVERSPRRWEEGRRQILRTKIPGLEEWYEPKSEETRRRLTHTDREDDHLMVAGLSPGFRWNWGVNEFYCVVFPDVLREEGRPTYQVGNKGRAFLQDCRFSYPRQALWEFTDEDELMAATYDGSFHQWCMQTNNRRKGRISMTECDPQNILQVWEDFFIDDDGTWRPQADDSRCVTAIPPKAGQTGGGKLKLKKCSKRGERRLAQTWVWCDEETYCDIDYDDFQEVFLNCETLDECGPWEP